ncbi:hypothetical protein D3C85_1790480 [compost metagenome]
MRRLRRVLQQKVRVRRTVSPYTLFAFVLHYACHEMMGRLVVVIVPRLFPPLETIKNALVPQAPIVLDHVVQLGQIQC